ncbi:hypothetical protein ANANG_G00182410 [Anguilla anguilla]|uniref:Uncharacterized protein n=1 Tax=Anguilla anguilla TaxID=7936 RepID=A0A9D3RXG4_ANGAN|nr:hypothetical protein ANANG_G00182410 [Anguilla anguilla]
MQSFGSASSWQSRDSPSSSHSFLHSEGDQTEDEADVFLSEGEGDSGRDQAGWCPGSTRVILVSQSGGVRTGGEGRTEGDFVFAQKCAELQGFVRPLLELLNGLKRGKYDRAPSPQPPPENNPYCLVTGLSTLWAVYRSQQFPAERCHGQDPEDCGSTAETQHGREAPAHPPAGGDDAQTVVPADLALRPAHLGGHAHPAGSLARGAAPRWRRDQLHIPVKKRRLSWMNTDSPAQAAPACKRVQREEPALGVTSSPSERASVRPGGRGARCEKEEGKEARGEVSSRPESRLAPVPHPSKESGEGRGGNTIPPVATAGSPATQDTFISSTTRLSPPLDPAPVTHEPVRCHSQPIATETEGGRGRASETSRRWNRSLPLQTKPFTAPEQ